VREIEKTAESIRKKYRALKKGRKTLSQHLGPLGQKYRVFVSDGGGKNKTIDTVHGVRLDKDGTMMFGSKKFDVDSSNHVVIDGMRCAVTPGLYELIFKRVRDYDTINVNIKAYCWLQTRVDALTTSTVIYGITGNTSIDM